MRSRLPGYSLLSLCSFVFFLSLFITVSNVQVTALAESSQQPFSTPIPTQSAEEVPAPTIYLVPDGNAPVSKYVQAVPIPTPTPLLTIAVSTDLDVLFTKYSTEYGVDKEQLKKIAKCESGFNPAAVNYIYLGMFQFDSSTWASTRNAMGMDTNPDLRASAEEAIRTAAFKISRGGINAWPNCK